jgi:hypothetical protein
MTDDNPFDIGLRAGRALPPWSPRLWDRDLADAG